MLAVAHGNYLTMLDFRQSQPVLNWKIKQKITALCHLGENHIFYGGDEGEVGIFDNRISKEREGHLWKNEVFHKKKIYDLKRVGGLVVSGDDGGNLISWSPIQQEKPVNTL